MRETGEKPNPGVAWARELEDEAAEVLHLPTRTIAKVRRFHDGVERVYLNPGDGEPVRGPVLEMVDGSSRVAVEGAFVKLTPDDVQFYLAAQVAVGSVVRRIAEQGSAGGIGRAVGLLIMSAVLRSTASVVDQVSAADPPGGA